MSDQDAARIEAERTALAEVTDDDLRSLLADIVPGVRVAPGYHGDEHLTGVVRMWLKRDFVRLNDADPETLERDRADVFARLIELLAPPLAESTGRPVDEVEDELRQAVAAVNGVGHAMEKGRLDNGSKGPS